MRSFVFFKEENAKKAKYRALKKSTQQRCRSADGRLKTKVQIPTEVSKTLPSSSQNRRVSREDDTGGSLESLPPNDYQYQLSKPRVVEVYNGRKISAPATITQLPRSRLTSITDSVGTATSLANGDIVRKVDDLIYENQGQNLLRRDSAASYKKVTFRYGGDAGRTVTLREERGASAETLEDLPLSSTKRVSSPKRTDSAQNSSFSSRFLGRLSSHTSPKIKRNATWHITHNNNNHNHNNNHNYNNNNNINRRPSSISPLNKLRAIIKKLMAENRRKKILNNLKQAAVLYHQQEQQTEKVAEQKKKEQQQQQKEQQQQQQLIKSRPSSIHPLMLVDLDNNSILSSPPPIDHIALVTLQNLQNQTMEDSYKDSGRSTINSNTNPTTTTTAPVHLRSRFGRSWSRREERPVNSQKTTEEQQYHWSADVTNKKTMTEEPQHHWPGVHNKQPTTEEQQHHWSDVKKKQPTTNDQHHWPTTLTLRRTPSMICSSKANNNVEVKLKRRSAAVMETSHLRNSKENVSSSNSNSGNKTNQLNQSQINRPQKANRQRVQPSKEKEQKQQQQQQQEQQNNKKPVVRRKSTTDKTTNSTTFKPLGM